MGFEVQFLIPEESNDNEPFSEERFEAFYDAILDSEISGFTEYPGTTFGGWEDPKSGKRYFDDSRIIGVTIEGFSQAEVLLDIIELGKELFDQKTLYIRYLGQTEIV